MEWLLEWLLKFLPAEKKAMVTFGMRILNCLDSSEERQAALDYGIEMLKDGKVTVGEWSRFGSKLGILKGPNA